MNLFNENRKGETAMPNFSRKGYDGTLFKDFFVARDACGPGWFIFGRDATKYGVHLSGPNVGKGCYVKLCGYVRERGARNYNGKVRHGWPRKRDAEAWLTQHLQAYPFLED